MNGRLYRSRGEGVRAGVAGGLADYLDVDPSLVRVVWAILALFSGGAFLIIYIVMALVVPEEPSERFAGTGPGGPTASPGQGAFVPPAEGGSATPGDGAAVPPGEGPAGAPAGGRGGRPRGVSGRLPRTGAPSAVRGEPSGVRSGPPDAPVVRTGARPRASSSD